MRAATNSNAGTGSELFPAVHTAHTRYNPPTVICDISTGRVQGSYRNAPKSYEGHIRDVDQTSSWRDGRGKAYSGSEAADFVEVVLIVDLDTACTS